MVRGQVVVEDGKILTIDEDSVASRLAEAASQPRNQNEEAFVKAMDELKQQVTLFHKGWIEKLRAEPYFDVNSWIDDAHDNPLSCEELFAYDSKKKTGGKRLCNDARARHTRA